MPVKQEDGRREVNMGRLRVVLTVSFFLCLALTIASIFMDVGPSFYKCAAATVILHFVREAAVQMSEKKS